MCPPYEAAPAGFSWLRVSCNLFFFFFFFFFAGGSSYASLCMDAIRIHACMRLLLRFLYANAFQQHSYGLVLGQVGRLLVRVSHGAKRSAATNREQDGLDAVAVGGHVEWGPSVPVPRVQPHGVALDEVLDEQGVVPVRSQVHDRVVGGRPAQGFVDDGATSFPLHLPADELDERELVGVVAQDEVGFEEQGDHLDRLGQVYRPLPFSVAQLRHVLRGDTAAAALQNVARRFEIVHRRGNVEGAPTLLVLGGQVCARLHQEGETLQLALENGAHDWRDPAGLRLVDNCAAVLRHELFHLLHVSL